MSFNFVQAQPFSAAGAGNSVGDTTLVLTSMLAIDGSTPLTMAMFGSVGYMTAEPGNNTQEEQISFSGITQNSNGTATLTGVMSVLFVSPYTESSGFAKTHPGGSQFIITNTAGFYNKLAVLSDAQTITGAWQFPNNASTPTLGASYVAPTLQNQVASKGYVDATASAGAANASTSVQGLVQLPTQAQTDAKTATGSTGAALGVTPALLRSTLLNDYVVDTGSANAYTIAPSPVISAYVAGQIFSFKAASANTTTSTVNVNGLGVKTIKNSVGGNLVANDILSGQMVAVEYDGTNFQMLNVSGRGAVGMSGAETVAGVKTFSSSPIAPTPSAATDVAIKSYVDLYATGTTTKNAADASTTQNIAHGLGRIPKKVTITAFTSAAGYQALTAYNGTTQNSVSNWYNGGFSTSAIFNLNSDTGSGSNAATTGVVTVDATNITITWTKNGSPTGTYTLLWEAQ